MSLAPTEPQRIPGIEAELAELRRIVNSLAEETAKLRKQVAALEVRPVTGSRNSAPPLGAP